MCRSIKVLRNAAQPATDDDVSKAALQYVRKISGFPKPSKVNREAYERAVRDIAEASRKLLEAIERPVAARYECAPTNSPAATME